MTVSAHNPAAAAPHSAAHASRILAARLNCRPVAARQPEIDGYRVLRMIGEARTAAFYLADDLNRGGKVALKVVKPAFCTEDVRERFTAECALLAAVQHEQVVRAYDYRTDGPPCYLAMEYLGGGSLRERMRRGISCQDAVSFTQRAASGLAEVHRRGIVHRDIKPENFLMRSPGQPILIDFGIAAARGDSSSRVPVGRLVGTACYASPEQAQGGAPCPADDVYSLGIVFYEMLRGRRPFPGTTVLEALSQHLVAPVPRLPGELTRYQPLVDRMLEKTHSRRLPDADAVLQEIGNLAADGPASTPS